MVLRPRGKCAENIGKGRVAKIQIRVDQGAFQGILQLNLDGRPDGRRPHGQDFALDYYRDELERYRREHGASDEVLRSMKRLAASFLMRGAASTSATLF